MLFCLFGEVVELMSHELSFCIGHKNSFSLLVFSCQMGSLLPIISYESGSLKLVNSININVVHISIKHHSDSDS